MTKQVFSAVIVVAIFVGVCFRFYNLGGKVYWHDEVYTSIRAAGYKKQEIEDRILQNKVDFPPSLRQYLDIKPGSSNWDTIDSLALEDPQHPPLYFLLSRWWMGIFGSDVVTMRLLAAIVSLAALPFMYALTKEVFGSEQIALLTTAFQALSPYDILFAQIARQYSLLTVVVLASNLCFLRMERLGQWWIYSLIAALGLYVHPFFAFTISAHGLCVAIATWQKKQGELLQRYCAAIGVALALYSPWIVVLATNYRRALETTSWLAEVTDWKILPRMWVLGFSSVFLDIGSDQPLTYLGRAPILLLAIVGLIVITRKLPQHRSFFWSFFIPFGILFTADFLLGGRRSTITRYLAPCFPIMHLSVGYFLGQAILRGNTLVKVWQRVASQVLIVLLFAGSILSVSISNQAEFWWTHIPTFVTQKNVQEINASPNPLVLSGQDDHYINLGNLLSLFLLLDDDVPVFLVGDPINLKDLPTNKNIFVFNPSTKLRKHIGLQNLTLVPETYGQLFYFKQPPL